MLGTTLTTQRRRDKTSFSSAAPWVASLQGRIQGWQPSVAAIKRHFPPLLYELPVYRGGSRVDNRASQRKNVIFLRCSMSGQFTGADPGLTTQRRRDKTSFSSAALWVASLQGRIKGWQPSLTAIKRHFPPLLYEWPVTGADPGLINVVVDCPGTVCRVPACVPANRTSERSTFLTSKSQGDWYVIKAFWIHQNINIQTIFGSRKGNQGLIISNKIWIPKKQDIYINKYWNSKNLYKTLVRSHLEYATVVWTPCLKRDKIAIGNVQRRQQKDWGQLAIFYMQTDSAKYG